MERDVVHVPRKVAGVIVAIVLVGGALFGYGIKTWSGRTVFGAQAVTVREAKDIAPVTLGSFANGFASVIKPALPAVVNIHSSKVVKDKDSGGMPFLQDPFFKQFFGDQFGQGQPEEPRSEREESLGSGVIVNPDGYILTNNHVIDGASDIKVDLSDRREFTAKVVGSDPKSDIAVLKIQANGLPTLAFSDSQKIQVGDLVFAIGDPFGVGETATMGIVSATGRAAGIEQGGYEDFIQTDASINPGNSGGALLDVHGNLVGINTAIITGGGGGNQGIGFAIPVNEARHVMDQIVEHGRVIRGYLGVYIQPVTPDIAQAFHLPQNNGVLLGDVTADGPAAKAGLKKGDVILDVNGEPVNATNQLQLQISSMAPGTAVNLKVYRDGTTQDMKVTLGELPNAKSEANNSNNNNESEPASLQGVQTQNLTPDIAEQMNLPAGTHGVVVTAVDPSSPAAGQLTKGDVIQEVNHKPVQNMQEFRDAISAAGKQPILLLVNRGGVTNYVVVQPSE